LDPVLLTFHIQDVLKLKKNNSGAKSLIPSLSPTTAALLLHTCSSAQFVNDIHTVTPYHVSITLPKLKIPVSNSSLLQAFLLDSIRPVLLTKT